MSESTMSQPTMHYVSTRGATPGFDFADVLLAGLADDGGLYVPERWPTLGPAPKAGAERTYVDVALEVMWPYVAGSIERAAFEQIVVDAYATFETDEVTPLVDVGEGHYVLELFHGPTLAFKDVALQLVGRLFDYELKRRGQRVTIVGATSGDTGSAAIEACRDRDAIDIVILHPEGRVSDVQRRQMTTVTSSNVFNVAIDGTFDDCQDLVKAMFADVGFRRDVRLSAVNSINWARVMAQIVYYVVAAERLGDRTAPISFSVPTGNFGNIFAGYAAKRMGLDVRQFIVASNENDILTQFFTTGEMTIGEVNPTYSPSMDIQVSSNLERLLFELYGRDGGAVRDVLARFRADGHVRLDSDRFGELRDGWSGARVTNAQTLAIIAEYQDRFAMLVDPHTAVGLGASATTRADFDVPLVTLATAHPAKFPDAVAKATGDRPPLPAHLADLFERPEKYTSLPNELGAVQAFVREASRNT